VTAVRAAAGSCSAGIFYQYQLAVQFSSVQYEYFYSAIKQDVALRPGSNIKPNPIRLLKFSPETVVSNILVAQVCWEAVPDTCPGSSKAPVVKCVVCAWNSARSVGRRAKPASRTF